MAVYQFIREIKVEIFDSNGNGNLFEARQLNNTNGYDISFSVEKNDEKEPNEATVEIWGLSEATRRKLESKFSYIRLHAGYKDNSKLIATGDISEIRYNKEGSDIKTTIKFQDGAESYRKSQVNKIITENTTFKRAIEEVLAPSMNLGQVKWGESIKDDSSQDYLKYFSPVTYSGPSKDIVDELVKSYGPEYKWFIQDGQLIIKKQTETINTTAILINQDTGLIGSPERLFRKKLDKSEDKNKDENDITCKVLLNPDLNAGIYIKVESEFLENYCVIKEVKHTGSNYDTSYYSDIKANIIK